MEGYFFLNTQTKGEEKLHTTTPSERDIPFYIVNYYVKYKPGYLARSKEKKKEKKCFFG
jgi:hypothetical protein